MAYNNHGWYPLDKAHDAPEVAVSGDPVALPPDDEGLQVVNSGKGDDVKEYRQDGAALAPEKVDERRRTSRRKLWLWVSLAATLALVGLGVGVGVGVTVGQKASDKSAPARTSSTPTSTSSPSTTAMVSPTQSSPPKPSGVTSGTTGIAAFSCNATVSDSTYTTSSGTTFTEQCYCDYVNGGPVWNDTSNSASKTQTFDNIGQFTVYSFQDCMGQCADWNAQLSGSQKQCVSVSYCANLTATVPGLAGNCFLKPARGVPYSNGNYSLWASAYIANLS